MDLNISIGLVVGLSCAVTIVRILSSPLARINSGWLIVSVALLTVLGVAWVLTPVNAGYIGGVLWLVFYLIPVLGYRQMNRLFAQQNYVAAYQVASVLRWLHPIAGWSNWMEVIQAMNFARQGDPDQAIQVLERNKNAPGWIGRVATGQLYTMTGNWQQMLTWLQANNSRLDPTGMGNYIRALGETGDLNGMIAALEQYRDVLRQGRALNPVAMFVLALSGESEGVGRLFQGPLKLYPAAIQKFWLGTAKLASGESAEGERLLTEVANSNGDARTRNAATLRLSRGVTLAQEMLTPQSREVLVRLDQILEQEQRYNTQAGGRPGIPYVTYALIAINVIVFIIEELNGGSTNFDTLRRMGVFLAPAIAAGDWWRLITPVFLHYGIAHIALNMLALFVLGPYVENTLGIFNYLILYLAAGIGSSLLVYALVMAGAAPNDFYLGASGAIMGVLGAQAAIMFRGWQRDKAPVARNGLIRILLIVALQVAIDASFILQSSLPAHLGGAVIGFVVAIFMPQHRVKAKTS